MQISSILGSNYQKFSNLQSLREDIPLNVYLGNHRKQFITYSFRNMKIFYGYLKIRKKLKTLNFGIFWDYKVFLFVNGLFKVLQCWNPDSMLWKLHQKAKFRLFRYNDLWQLGFQNGKKDENFDFTEIFSF